MSKISIYTKVTDTTSTDTIPFDIFLDNIKSGHWWPSVGKVRTAKNKDDLSYAKKGLPMVTISGSFATRTDEGITEHSGFICIDIDETSPDDVKMLLAPDDYVYAIFTSCSGKGAAVVFKIDGKRHRDAFQAISKHLFESYSLVVDPTCINESRGRFVSHDPDIYINTNAKKWSTYIPKKEFPKFTETKTVFVKNDFENIIQEICAKQIDISGNYHNWLKVGFALADKFGEDGRNYFQYISQYRDGSKASTEALINKQYDNCIKAKGNGVSIATFYYFVKKAGIEIYSTETKEIVKVASSQKRSAGMDNAAIITNLKQHTDFNHANIEEIVPQVHADTYAEDVSLIEHIDNEIKNCYEIRLNIITRNIEQFKKSKWSRMDTVFVNSMFLTLKKNFDKLSKELFETILMSDMTNEYNPFTSFIDENLQLQSTGNIKSLASTITSGFGLTGDDREYFIRKWIIGIIASIHGDHSPLMLVLTGEEQNTGKTQWFRRFLPDQLRPYYAESKMDSGKDDEILMTQKLIIMDDEMGGKSKKEIARIKELTSKQTFSLREPYGRNNVDLNRIAVLCGTSNENGVLNDPTGNRRIIPIHVTEIDHNVYNAINKAELFMEAYYLWKNGETHNLTKEDIKLLNDNTQKDFEEVSMEEELIFKYFKIPTEDYEGDYFTTSDIITHIDYMTRQKLYPKKVGSYIQKNGIKRGRFKRNGMVNSGYKLVKVDYVKNEDNDGVKGDDKAGFVNQFIPDNEVFDFLDDDLPF